jgi:hypothetical protein
MAMMMFWPRISVKGRRQIIRKEELDICREEMSV